MWLLVACRCVRSHNTALIVHRSAKVTAARASAASDARRLSRMVWRTSSRTTRALTTAVETETTRASSATAAAKAMTAIAAGTGVTGLCRVRR